MNDINDYLTAGSMFVTSTTTNILSPRIHKEYDLDVLCEKILELVKEKKIVDVPLIMETFHVDAIKSLEALDRLKKKGLLKENSE